MYCSKCGSRGGEGLSYCRKCGADLETLPLAPVVNSLRERKAGALSPKRAQSADPDELTASGIGSFIVGDGFFITGVLLSVTHSSISSVLWLLLLIPAFICFGRGLRDVLLAKQIRERSKQEGLKAAPPAELPPRQATVADIIGGRASGELLRAPRPSKRTTGEL